MVLITAASSIQPNISSLRGHASYAHAGNSFFYDANEGVHDIIVTTSTTDHITTLAASSGPSPSHSASQTYAPLNRSVTPEPAPLSRWSFRHERRKIGQDDIALTEIVYRCRYINMIEAEVVLNTYPSHYSLRNVQQYFF
jgi:hypothetical protein